MSTLFGPVGVAGMRPLLLGGDAPATEAAESATLQKPLASLHPRGDILTLGIDLSSCCRHRRGMAGGLARPQSVARPPQVSGAPWRECLAAGHPAPLDPDRPVALERLCARHSG